jgi:uncharacterized protein with HEPN domain
MPSDALTVLDDIDRHLRLAIEFAAGFDLDSFQNDTRTVYAVTRCLEIISEASRRLPEEIKARHPSIPWRDIAGAGNVYRHDYEDVAARVIWDTVQLALPTLQKVITKEIELICGPANSENITSN